MHEDCSFVGTYKRLKKKTCEVQASVIKNLVKLTLHAWLNGKSLKMKRRGKMRLALSVL
jgi:predicted nucleotidyltransferase